jgi:lipoprotein-anchoring transpeptidase ErfK/SrfK
MAAATEQELRANRWVDVDVRSQRASAYQGDKVVKEFVVSTGTAYFPTVIGQFHIYRKYQYSDMYGPGYYLPSVPFVMYFYEGYALHGVYWHHKFGTPWSRGCVNFTVEDAQWLFDFTSMGTLVNVH